MTDPRDLALLQTLPPVPVPRFGALDPLGENGQRLLLADNGVFLEVRRAWLHAVCCCGQIDAGIPLPFGKVEEGLSLPFGAIPRRLLDRFVEVARQRLPNEAAGGIVLDTATGQFDLRIYESSHCSAARIDYLAAPLGETESLVVDIHSHGSAPAGFSAQDDMDDSGTTKFAVVVGSLDRTATRSAQIAIRLYLNGLTVPVEFGCWSPEGDEQ